VLLSHCFLKREVQINAVDHVATSSKYQPAYNRLASASGATLALVTARALLAAVREEETRWAGASTLRLDSVAA
jgi:hypothetical protein